MKDNKLVHIKTIIPDIILDIRYATTNNFLNKKLYSKPICLLRYGVAKKLLKVQQQLKKQGLGLKIYDGYRPLSVTKIMYNLSENKLLVAPPTGSNHNRGAAVDITLVKIENGEELLMPSYFDFYNPIKNTYIDYEPILKKNILSKIIMTRKKRYLPIPLSFITLYNNLNQSKYSYNNCNYSLCNNCDSNKSVNIEAKKNSSLLKSIMIKNGFTPLTYEWWHFDSNDCYNYPILDIPI